MSKEEEKGLKSLLGGTAWMTFAVLGYTAFNLIYFHNPVMKGNWPMIGWICLIAGIALAVYSVWSTLIGIRTKFSEYHEPSIPYSKLVIAAVAAIIVTEIIAFFILKQGLTAGMILLPVVICWGALETAAVEKFYEIGGFMLRQTSKTTHLLIGTVIIGVLCALSYPMVNAQLGYWMLMIPQLIMVIVMLMINNIVMSV